MFSTMNGAIVVMGAGIVLLIAACTSSQPDRTQVTTSVPDAAIVGQTIRDWPEKRMLWNPSETLTRDVIAIDRAGMTSEGTVDSFTMIREVERLGQINGSRSSEQWNNLCSELTTDITEQITEERPSWIKALAYPRWNDDDFTAVARGIVFAAWELAPFLSDADAFLGTCSFGSQYLSDPPPEQVLRTAPVVLTVFSSTVGQCTADNLIFTADTLVVAIDNVTGAKLGETVVGDAEIETGPDGGPNDLGMGRLVSVCTFEFDLPNLPANPQLRSIRIGDHEWLPDHMDQRGSTIWILIGAVA